MSREPSADNSQQSTDNRFFELRTFSFQFSIFNFSASWRLADLVSFFLGVPLRVGLSAISFSATLQKDAAPIPNAFG